MNQEIINEVLCQMIPHLSNDQIVLLKNVLEGAMLKSGTGSDQSDEVLVDSFIAAKRLEGCSERTLVFYRNTIDKMLDSIEKNIKAITTEDLRGYLSEYQNSNMVSKVTIDNIRRNLSSFFSWLEDENYIVKSPARRIHKIRVSIQTNSLHGGMAFRIASSQDSFPVMGFCVHPRFSNNLSNKCPKSTQNTPVCNKTH